jgi:uncharacterized OsmC-like protein
MKIGTTSIVNGVDVTRLQETIAAVKASPDLGRFIFQIDNQWINGGANRSHVQEFYGSGRTQSHTKCFLLAADEPDVLLGGDTGANPVEHLLHALLSCVTTSMVYHAAVRGIEIEQVESSLEGDLDLRGFMGLDPTVRNGYRHLRLKLRIKANVSDEQLKELSNLGPMFSPVHDTLLKGVPITVAAERLS